MRCKTSDDVDEAQVAREDQEVVEAYKWIYVNAIISHQIILHCTMLYFHTYIYISYIDINMYIYIYIYIGGRQDR